ncbi:MAG TPA: response regulator transcription factor [Candidatus Eisenbacteria bacterium]|nr:response regulator transcription factor [Candidatus Eisenbacteria bacterium]
MSNEKILIVDDDPQFRRTMRAALHLRGFLVSEAESGEVALERIREERPQLILLDINMQGLNGLECCREMRAALDAPIIMISVRDQPRDKIQALNSGADDYLTKPFHFEELVARLNANLRRVPHSPLEDLQAMDLEEVHVDFLARTVTVKDKNVQLTRKEFELLSYLVAHAGQVVTHRKLLQAIWGPDYGDEAEYLRVCVNHLRKKIEPDPSNPKFLLTAVGMGYRFVLPPANFMSA